MPPGVTCSNHTSQTLSILGLTGLGLRAANNSNARVVGEQVRTPKELHVMAFVKTFLYFALHLQSAKAAPAIRFHFE